MFGVADIESYYMSSYDQNTSQGVIKTTFIVLNYSVCLLFSTTLKTERTVFAIQLKIIVKPTEIVVVVVNGTSNIIDFTINCFLWMATLQVTLEQWFPTRQTSTGAPISI